MTATQGRTGQQPHAISMLDTVTSLAAEVTVALDALLDQSGLHDIDTSGSDFVFIGPSNVWDPLPDQAMPTLRAAQDALHAWQGLAQAAVDANDRYKSAEFRKHFKLLEQIVNRSKRAAGLWEDTIDKVRSAASEAVGHQLTMVRMLALGGGFPGPLWLPDTNALLFQPNLGQWPDVAATLVVTPPILSELDDLKEGRKGPVIKAKAEAVIGSLNEMGRRGDTLAGVRVHGQLLLREVAIDPDMSRAPSWLKADSMDDRFIAAALELAFRDLAAPILLVTRDRNLKNKARQARLACDEPRALGVPATRIESPL